MKDTLALLFMLLSIFVGLPLAGASIALVFNRKGIGKYVVIFFAVLTVMLTIGTFVNALIGGSKEEYDSHHPCTWVALGLSCGAMGVGLIDLIIAVFVRISKNMSASQPASNNSGEMPVQQTNNGYVVVKKKIDGDVALFTASSNVGIGLWTSICVSFAAIFGVESTNYTKKLDIVLNRVRGKLEELMKEYPEFEYRDFRVVKEGNIAYTASVMGIRKK